MNTALPPWNWIEILMRAEISAQFYLNELTQWHVLGQGFAEGAD